MSNWQKSGHLGLEQLDEFRVHEVILVWNFQADDPLIFQEGPKLLRDFASMALLHDKDNLGPLNQLRC